MRLANGSMLRLYLKNSLDCETRGKYIGKSELCPCTVCQKDKTDLDDYRYTGPPREILQGGTRLHWGPGDLLIFLNKLKIV